MRKSFIAQQVSCLISHVAEKNPPLTPPSGLMVLSSYATMPYLTDHSVGGRHSLSSTNMNVQIFWPAHIMSKGEIFMKQYFTYQLQAMIFFGHEALR